MDYKLAKGLKDAGFPLDAEMETKHPGGRPLKFETLEELEDRIDEYFNNTPKEEWTITGLAIALDTFRSVLCDYGSGKYDDEDREYSYTIKKAKHMVEHSYEVDLKKHGRTGTIFALKNFDWKDKTETDITSGGEKIDNSDLDPVKLALIKEFNNKLREGEIDETE